MRNRAKLILAVALVLSLVGRESQAYSMIPHRIDSPWHLHRNQKFGTKWQEMRFVGANQVQQRSSASPPRTVVSSSFKEGSEAFPQKEQDADISVDDLWSHSMSSTSRPDTPPVFRLGSVVRMRSAENSKRKLAQKIVEANHPLLFMLIFRWPMEWLRGERALRQIARSLPAAERNETEDLPVPGNAGAPETFDLSGRYKISGKVGKGAFASVMCAKDTILDKVVAIKCAADAIPDRHAYHRLAREVGLLRQLRGHSNIISISNSVIRHREVYDESMQGKRNVTDVYLITDLMMADLSKLMDSDCVFTNEQVRCIMFQFLRALAHLQNCEVVHRDIKPSNLLLDRLWHLKICDLGIAREAMACANRERMEDYDILFTDYVVTRPYRAPELLMGSKNYTSAVDMWAAGCILAELIAGQMDIHQAPMTRNTSAGLIRLPLFPGFDHRDMVQRIIQALGHPSDEVLDRLSIWEPRAKNFVQKQAYRFCDIETKKEFHGVENSLEYCSLDGEERVNFRAIFPWGDDDAVDLMEKLLVYDPEQRLTAEEALEHPYFKKHIDKFVQEHFNMSVITQNDAEIAFRRAAVRSAGKSWEKFWDERDRKIWKRSA